jgi:hypothetical protein
MLIFGRDIVAEMSTLPTSSITQYQSSIMYPENVCESFPLDGMGLVVPLPRKEADQDKEMMIYSSQIYLRVILNEAHNTLYGCKASEILYYVNKLTKHSRQKQEL